MRIKTTLLVGLSFVLTLQSVVAAALVTPIWKVRVRAAGDESPVVVDAAGNTYIAKCSYEDDQTLTLVKRDPRGRLAWVKSIRHEALPIGIAVDSAGSVYLTGIQYNYGNPTNFEDTVTWRFSKHGRLLWRVVYPGPETDDEPKGIGLDEAGHVYVAGNSSGSRYGDPSFNSYFVRYDAAGNVVWTRQFGPEFGGVQTMAINPEGGIAGIGRSSVIVCSGEGELLWSWKADDSFVSAFDSTLFRIAGFDHDDQLFVAGTISSEGVQLPVVRKFSWTGDITWTAAYRGPAENPGEPLDLRVDLDGNAYLGLDGAIACQYKVLDEFPELVCDYRPTIVKFSPAGDVLWASRFAGNSSFIHRFAGMTLDSHGNIFLAARAIRYDPATRDYISLLGECDADGNQIWSGFFHYRSERDLWTLPPAVDVRGRLHASAGLIDRQSADSDVDLLLATFFPFRFAGSPQMNIQPSPQSVAVGGTVTMEADAFGKGDLDYRWRFNSKPLPNATKRVLTLSNVQLNQAGDYSVEVRNLRGSITSPEARLTVLP